MALHHRTSATPAATAAPALPWVRRLPTLHGQHVILRELRRSDARSMYANLGRPEIGRYIDPPPSTVEGFETFIEWTHRERRAKRHLCFGVETAEKEIIGVFQMWPVERSFSVAEWGFVVCPDLWGTGVFVDGARAALRFAFEVLGVKRIEARAAVANGRGNGALRKLGAVREGVLHKCFPVRGELTDHVMWAILAADWHRPEARTRSTH